MIQEDPENPGRYFYIGDYNGEGKEPDGHGQDFRATRFPVPTLNEIVSRLNSEKLRLYRKMITAGFTPSTDLLHARPTLRLL